MTAERVVVDPPPDANLGRCLRARPVDEIAEMRRLHAAGVSPRDLARMFDVSLRTAYRYLDRRDRLFTITVDGWTATFARRPYHAPWRVSPWKRER